MLFRNIRHHITHELDLLFKSERIAAYNVLKKLNFGEQRKLLRVL